MNAFNLRIAAVCALLVFPLASAARADFITILNIPPDPAPSSIGSQTQLNLFEGGVLPPLFDAAAIDGTSTEVEVNISGGSVGDHFRAYSGSEVNISGGSVGDFFIANSGSVVNISGGSVGGGFGSGGSMVSLFGGEFMLNGAAYSSPTITLAPSDVFTGTLEDGSVFIFASEAFDSLVGVNLVATPVPPLDTTPLVISSDNGPHGLRAGQSLTLLEGGVLGDNFAVVNATMSINGGVVGKGLEVVGSVVTISGGTVGYESRAYESVVNISGGSVGDGFRAYSGSEVNISGGSVGNTFVAYESMVNISGGSVGGGFASGGSEVNISGGTFGNVFQAYNSKVNISGGSVGDHFRAYSGSEVNISGGTFGNVFDANSGSMVSLFGGEFMLNGAAYSSPTITLVPSDIFTGTLEDGSVFIFASEAFDSLVGVNLVATPVPPLDTTPLVISSDNGPHGLRAGQSLTLLEGGVLGDNFAVVNATMSINGGVVGKGLEVVGSEVTISGGTVGISSSVANYINVYSGSLVNISGGSLYSDGIKAFSGSKVNLFVRALFLNGSPVDLVLGEPLLITARDGVLLEAVLADGSYLDLPLLTRAGGFHPSATLTATLVPEPSSWASALVGLLLGGAIATRRRRSAEQALRPSTRP